MKKKIMQIGGVLYIYIYKKEYETARVSNKAH